MTIPIRSTAHDELDNEPPTDYMIGGGAAQRTAAAIAALRALAEWLAAHPDVPAPLSITAHAHLHDDLGTALDRIAVFTALHGGTRKQHGATLWAEMALPGTGPAEVTYRILTSLPGGDR